jgi:hypothetical protein
MFHALEPCCFEVTNDTPMTMCVRVTNAESNTCHFMMVERGEGVASVVSYAPHSTSWAWIRPNVEWIESSVEPGATMRLHCDASRELMFTARAFNPYASHFRLSEPSVYRVRCLTATPYSLCVQSVQYLSEDNLTKRFFVHLKAGSDEGIETVRLGKHVISYTNPENSALWGDSKLAVAVDVD